MRRLWRRMVRRLLRRFAEIPVTPVQVAARRWERRQVALPGMPAVDLLDLLESA